MEYIFLIAAIWNLWGGFNYLFFPEKQAKNLNYPSNFSKSGGSLKKNWTTLCSFDMSIMHETLNQRI